MGFVVTCECGARMRVSEKVLGKQGKCVGCGKVLTITPENTTALGEEEPSRKSMEPPSSLLHSEGLGATLPDADSPQHPAAQGNAGRDQGSHTGPPSGEGEVPASVSEVDGTVPEEPAGEPGQDDILLVLDEDPACDSAEPVPPQAPSALLEELESFERRLQELLARMRDLASRGQGQEAMRLRSEFAVLFKQKVELVKKLYGPGNVECAKQLIALGGIQSVAGAFREADGAYSEARRILAAKEGKASHEYGAATYGLAKCLLKAKQTQRALRLLCEAKVAFIQSGETSDELESECWSAIQAVLRFEPSALHGADHLSASEKQQMHSLQQEYFEASRAGDGEKLGGLHRKMADMDPENAFVLAEEGAIRLLYGITHGKEEALEAALWSFSRGISNAYASYSVPHVRLLAGASEAFRRLGRRDEALGWARRAAATLRGAPSAGSVQGADASGQVAGSQRPPDDARGGLSLRDAVIVDDVEDEYAVLHVHECASCGGTMDANAVTRQSYIMFQGRVHDILRAPCERCGQSCDLYFDYTDTLPREARKDLSGIQVPDPPPEDIFEWVRSGGRATEEQPPPPVPRDGDLPGEAAVPANQQRKDSLLELQRALREANTQVEQIQQGMGCGALVVCAVVFFGLWVMAGLTVAVIAGGVIAVAIMAGSWSLAQRFAKPMLANKHRQTIQSLADEAGVTSAELVVMIRNEFTGLDELW